MLPIQCNANVPFLAGVKLIAAINSMITRGSKRLTKADGLMVKQAGGY